MGCGFALPSQEVTTLLLTVYSIGLGVPFLLTALLLSTAINQFRRLNRYMRVIEVGSGLLLIAALLFTGNLQVLNGYLNALFMRLGLTFLCLEGPYPPFQGADDICHENVTRGKEAL